MTVEFSLKITSTPKIRTGWDGATYEVDKANGSLPYTVWRHKGRKQNNCPKHVSHTRDKNYIFFPKQIQVLTDSKSGRIKPGGDSVCVVVEVMDG